jgi:RNA:NAD 2'-phosphotransferase (TPT1/KptA family)
MHLNAEKPWEQLVSDVWELDKHRVSDPHWDLPEDRQQLANAEMVVPPGYACYEYSEHLGSSQRFEIAEFDDHAIWARANVRWNAAANSKHGWWKQQAKKLTMFLRHKAPLPQEKTNFLRVPMDRGGWISIRECAAAMEMRLDDLISLCWSMSKESKNRVQLAVEMQDERGVSKFKGVALIRAAQGHSIPFVNPARIGAYVSADAMKQDVCCVCHVTTWEALAHILQGGLKPGGGASRAATLGLETTDIRKESMLAPYAFWMGENLRSGMRRDSPLYIFFNKDALAELIQPRAAASSRPTPFRTAALSA